MQEGKYRLTIEGYKAAWQARADKEGKKLTLRLMFKYATEGKGVLMYISCLIGMCIFYSVGVLQKKLKAL